MLMTSRILNNDNSFNEKYFASKEFQLYSLDYEDASSQDVNKYIKRVFIEIKIFIKG